MANENENIDGFVVFDSTQKPRFLDEIGSFDDFRNVGIPRKVVENTKRHDPDPWQREIKPLNS